MERLHPARTEAFRLVTSAATILETLRVIRHSSLPILRRVRLVLSSNMPDSRDLSEKTLHKIEAQAVEPRHRTLLERLLSPFKELFGLSHTLAIISLIGTTAILLLAVYWFFRLAPPHTLVISAGPEGSAFHTNAIKYFNILNRNGVELRIL